MDVKFRMRNAMRAGAVAAFAAMFAIAGHAQEVCLSPERVSELSAAASDEISPPLNTALQDEILGLHRQMIADAQGPTVE